MRNKIQDPKQFTSLQKSCLMATRSNKNGWFILQVKGKFFVLHVGDHAEKYSMMVFVTGSTRLKASQSMKIEHVIESQCHCGSYEGLNMDK